jgi:hypothetical protein
MTSRKVKPPESSSLRGVHALQHNLEMAKRELNADATFLGIDAE